MGKGISTVVFGITVTLSAAAVQAEEYNINPGMWETATEMKVSGVPPEMAAMMQQPPKTERECVKDREVDFQFRPEDMGEECAVRTTQHDASKVRWEMHCTGKDGSASGRGEMHFNGDTTSGWFEVNMQDGPMGPMKMRHSFQGRRIGPC
ncbi:MAG TPA: DUF3617 domain-containing protein [Chromatiales bacterium]|nr:DUF3617 domain-containing protein [Chromatiales bacterium]